MVLLPTAAISAAPSIETLQKLCSEKELVFLNDASGKIFQAGEKFNTYCAGFLQGVVLTLQNEKLICPDKTDSADSAFLLSVIEFYIRDVSPNETDASTVAAGAFKRAFTCNESGR